jgi:hypothetical protein
VAQETTSALRANLTGLSGAERVIFSAILTQIGASTETTGSDHNVLFLDWSEPENRNLFQSSLCSLHRAVTVAVCDAEDSPPEGVVVIQRPLRTEHILKALHALQPIGSTSPLPQEVRIGPAPARGSGIGLRDLAARYRFELARLHTVLVSVGDFDFYLLPQKYQYISAHSPDLLRAVREATTQGNLIRVETHAQIKCDADPRRLDEFLWYLGLNAGRGQLLPWLTGDLAFRLTRWPSVVRRNNDAAQVRLATLMARRTLKPSELCHATGITFDEVADILNGCSMAGCLEGTGSATGDGAHNSQPASGSPKNSTISSLLGRIRLKLGLA